MFLEPFLDFLSGTGWDRGPQNVEGKETNQNHQTLWGLVNAGYWDYHFASLG